MLLNKLKAVRDAGCVMRYHTTRVLRPESVAEHSFNVVNLILVLTDGQASKNLLMAALTHDMGETAVGDIPSPVKRALPPEVAEEMERIESLTIHNLHPELDLGLTSHEAHILSLADKMDGLMKCREELLLGNKLIIPIGERYIGYLMTMTDENPLLRYEVEQVIQAFRREYL